MQTLSKGREKRNKSSRRRRRKGIKAGLLILIFKFCGETATGVARGPKGDGKSEPSERRPRITDSRTHKF